MSSSAKTPPNTPDPNALRIISETNGFTLGRPTHIRVVRDGSAVLYLRSGAKSRNASLYELDTKTNAERLLVAPEDLLGGEKETLSVEEKAARERKRISTAGFTQFELSQSGDRVLVVLSGKPWLIDRKTRKHGEIALPSGGVLDPRLSPDGKRLAFVREHNLAVVDLGAIEASGKVALGPVVAITTDGTADVSYGTAEFVAQEEMNRFHGYWWSPDSLALAYQRTDDTQLERFTLADASHPEQPASVFPYPRPGKNNSDVRLFVASVDGRTRTEVTWDRKAFPYLARVLWQKNAPLTLLVQSRDQKTEELLAADVGTGATRLLHREEDPAWLNLSTSAPRWLPDGQSYLFATERSGAWSLERHTLAPGGKTEVVVPASAGFQSLVHVDVKQGLVWFLGGPKPTETLLYATPLSVDPSNPKPPVLVSPPGGEHDATFAEEAPTFVLTRNDRAALARSTIHVADGAPVTMKGAVELPSKAMEPTFVPNLELVPRARAGGLEAAILRPHGFEASKKYPVVLYVYGGPTITMVHDAMGPYFIPQWIADHGFVVVSIDGRGTPKRGRDFERAVRGAFGSVPLDEQVKGLTALGESYPELDLTRVGVYGWSFGGYMAALSVLRRPDVFKVAVAGAPVVDWRYYDTHYTERYLGVPTEGSPAYASSSLLTYASKLERPLLLVHGIADDNVYFAHTLQLADALFRAKRPFSILPLVGLTHQVADPAVREALYSRVVGFLADALDP